MEWTPVKWTPEKEATGTRSAWTPQKELSPSSDGSERGGLLTPHFRRTSDSDDASSRTDIGESSEEEEEEEGIPALPRSEREDFLMQPVYEGAPCKLIESVLSAMYKNLSGKASKTSISSECKFRKEKELPQPNTFPSSYYRMLRLLNIDLNNLGKLYTEYHCCHKGCCMNFPQIPKSEWESHRFHDKNCLVCHCSCGQPRFIGTQVGSPLTPAEWGLHLGFKRAIASLESDPTYLSSFNTFDRRAEPENEYEAPSQHVSPYFRSIDEYARENMGVSAYDRDQTYLCDEDADWQSIFNRESNSAGVVAYTPMDVHASIRAKLRYTKLLVIMAGPKEPVNVDGHLFLLNQERLELRTNCGLHLSCGWQDSETVAGESGLRHAGALQDSGLALAH